jgi:hypothetical protein
MKEFSNRRPGYDIIIGRISKILTRLLTLKIETRKLINIHE